MTRSSTSTLRMIADARYGASAASWSPRVRSGGGDAILAYLAAARPKATEEHLFLRAQAPFRPFRSSAEIAGIVARTRDRGGIEGVPTGSHVFRHSLATKLLRAGAGLESVGTILRHSSPATTAIYAKVVLPRLMKIAQP